MTVAVERIWAGLPIPAVVLDAGDRIASVNPAAESFLNASARSLLGQPALDILAIDADLDSRLTQLRGDGGTLFFSDVDVGSGSRIAVPCDLYVAPLGDGDGAVVMTFAPLGHADRLTRGQRPASAAKSAIGMAEMLAHEIKNPLAGITGAAQLLAAELSGEDRELTDLIVAESRRIVTLLERVEQFGNLSPPARRGVNVHDLLDRARKSAELGVAAHMRFVEEYDPSLPMAHVDGDQILQVLLNLIRNAAEARGQAPGRITLRSFYDVTLRLRRKGAASAALPLQIEVEDDGPGLPPEIAASIFEPFVSGRENGTGLGLALVSKIVADHEAWITVDSVPGRTVFRLSLPLLPRDLTSKEVT